MDENDIPADRGRIGSRRDARVAIAAGATATMLAVGYLLWWLCRPPRLAGTRLTDGTEIVLRGLTHGKGSTFDSEPRLFRWLEMLRIPLRLQPLHYSTSPNSTLWLNALSKPSVITSDPNAEVTAQVEDSHGCCTQIGSLDPSYDGTQQVELPFQPVSDEFWNLRLLGAPNRDQEMGRLSVRIPGRPLATKPYGNATTLPQTVSGRGLRATIGSLQHRRAGTLPCSIARFSAMGSGGAEDRWLPMDITAIDSRGRRGGEPVPELWDLETDWDMPFNGTCVEEPYWKLHVTFGPNPPTSRKPDFRWGRFRFPIRDGEPTNAGRSIRRADRGLALGVGDGLNTDRYRRGVETLWVPVSLSKGSVKLIVAVERINGETPEQWYRRRGISPGEQPDFGRYAYTGARFHWLENIVIPVTPGMKEIELDLVGYRTETLEFHVKP